MKKAAIFILVLMPWLCMAQPGTLQIDSLLKYVDERSFESGTGSTELGFHGIPYMMGLIDSAYFYHIDNGKQPQRTEKYVLIADSIINSYYNKDDSVFNQEVYSKKSGKLLHYLTKNGDTGDFFYGDDWRIDSTYHNHELSSKIIREDNRESRYLSSGFLWEIKNFDDDGHLVKLYFGPRWNDSTTTVYVFNWENDRLVHERETRTRGTDVWYDKENTFERDERGVVKTLIFTDHDRGKIFKIAISYIIGKNEQGQTTITCSRDDDPSMTYVFDEHGNWVGKLGKYSQFHRVLFYKK